MSVSVPTGADPACDAFVRRRPEAKLCHLPAWGAMAERVMGLRSFYLVAREGGEVRGVLPMTQVKSRLFGNRMISQAYASYGGPLAEDRKSIEALFRRAVEIATELGCESIELRSDQELGLGLEEPTGKIAMRLRLLPDPEELWRSFRSETKVRNHIRKAEKKGVTAEAGGLELLDEFYDVYTRRMHQLGSPCYARRLFSGMLETFPDNTRMFVARFEGQTVAARLVFHFNGLVESVWGITRVEFNRLSPNHLLYWTVFKHYCTQGAEWFDFGPSTLDSPHHKFKKQWDCQRIDLKYRFWVRPGTELTVRSPNNPKYRRKIELWKKLPLWATRILGPILSRSLP